MGTPAETRLGTLLVQDGLITSEQLSTALSAQSERATYIPLGRLMVELGLVTQRQLNEVINRHNKRLKLGEVLRLSRSITEQQLQHGMQEQQRVRRQLGEVLKKLGYLTDEAMRQALCLQLDIAYIDLDRMELDKGLTRLINRGYARKHWLVPVSHVGQVLTISMNDPTRKAVAEEIGQLTGFLVTVVTSSYDAIKRAFTRLYDETLDPEPRVPAGAQAETISVEDAPQGAAAGLRKSKYVSEYAEDRKADAAVRELLALALERKASDIHLDRLVGGIQVRLRIDGVLQEPLIGQLQQAMDRSARQVLSRIKMLAKLDIAEQRRPQDGSFRVRLEKKGGSQSIDIRVSFVPGYYGESCVLRVLDKRNAPTSLDALGFSPKITAKLRQLLQRPSGLILITGPTGSGKTTTIYASLMTAYRPEIRVLTAEDPIEHVYEQFSQSEVNDRIGNTFARYLRAFLRHDPEVMMIGEIRDEETAEMACRAAQTGHLLISTLHTTDAISAVPRLLDLHVDPNLLASSLNGVLAQRLARMVCSGCREAYQPPDDLVKEFFARPPVGLTFYRGTGCEFCNFTGYRGRTSIAELWVPTQLDVILISKNAPFDDIRASAREGTITMGEDIAERLLLGKTNLEELIRVMPYASVFQFHEMTKAGFPPGQLPA